MLILSLTDAETLGSDHKLILWLLHVNTTFHHALRGESETLMQSA